MPRFVDRLKLCPRCRGEGRCLGIEAALRAMDEATRLADRGPHSVLTLAAAVNRLADATAGEDAPQAFDMAGRPI